MKGKKEGENRKKKPPSDAKLKTEAKYSIRFTTNCRREDRGKTVRKKKMTRRNTTPNIGWQEKKKRGSNEKTRKGNNG